MMLDDFPLSEVVGMEFHSHDAGWFCEVGWTDLDVEERRASSIDIPVGEEMGIISDLAKSE